jgi:PHP family Zn ribbon phosphoesterase
MLSDLHIHSNFSDGKLSISEIVDFYGKREFKIIAITDHLCEEETLLGHASRYLKKTLTINTFQEYLHTIKVESERAKRQYDMLVVPGIEITKNSVFFNKSAHILAIGINDYISADGEIIDIIEKIHAQNAIAIAAHPVSTKKLEHQTYELWNNREHLKHYFDAWEAASGPHLFEEVLESGLPIIANSDFHNCNQIESWKNLFDCHLNFTSLKSAIKNQNLELVFYKEKEKRSEQLINHIHKNYSIKPTIQLSTYN